MEKDWEKIFSSPLQLKVQMMKSLLAQSEIESIIINRQDSFYKSLGEIELYVKRENILKAIQIINKATGE